MPSAARFARYLPVGARQIPEKSGLPSGVFGAGAFRFAVPFARRGIPGVGRFNHCACAADAATTNTTDARVTRSVTVVLLISTPECRRNIHPITAVRIVRAFGSFESFGSFVRGSDQSRNAIGANFFVCAFKFHLILKSEVNTVRDAARAGRRRASPLVLKCEADSFCNVRCFFERGSAGCRGSKMPGRTGKRIQRFS